MAIISLDNIRFTSYKKFAGSETLNLRPVTVLIGKNSSGKSSIARLFPMLRKSLSGQLKGLPLSFSNDGVSLGVSFGNLSHNGVSVGLKFGVTLSSGISIDVTLMATMSGEIVVSDYVLNHNDKTYTLSIKPNNKYYSCRENGKEYLVSDINGFIHRQLFEELGIGTGFLMPIDYIGPLRITPERTIYYNRGEGTNYVGTTGKYAYDMFIQDEGIRKGVSEWFKRSFDGCSIFPKTMTEQNAYQIMLHKGYMDGYDVNLVDEGMGMTQVFPIIVRSCMPVQGSTVVIEQPELHLHPAAHAELARLFARTSKAYSQKYVVETHSETLLMGLRDAVVDPDIDFTPKDVIIYFIDEDESGAYLRPIEIQEDGVLTDWPEGVFYENYELLKEIRRKVQQL